MKQHFFTTLLTALVSIMPSASSGQGADSPPAGAPAQPQASPPEPQPSAEPLQTRVYPLKFARAVSVARTIKDSLADVRCVPDEITNSVIVSAASARSPVVEQLLKVLDTKNETPVQVFRLVSLQPEATAKVLNALFPGIRVAISTNALIVSHDPASMKVVERLIVELDQKEVIQENRSIRFIWLVSDMKLPPPPEDMADVVKQLDSLGVRNLGLAAQNVVKAVSNSTFTISSSPAAFTQCHVQIDGTLRQLNTERPQLEISLKAFGVFPGSPPDEQSSPGPRPPRPPGSPPPGMSELAAIRTTLFLRPGHKEILAVTPIGSSSSVFILQILEAE